MLWQLSVTDLIATEYIHHITQYLWQVDALRLKMLPLQLLYYGEWTVWMGMIWRTASSKEKKSSMQNQELLLVSYKKDPFKRTTVDFAIPRMEKQSNLINMNMRFC